MNSKVKLLLVTFCLVLCTVSFGQSTCQETIAAGQKLPYDLSGPAATPDCHIDIYDLEFLTAEWLYCNDPENPDCDNPYAGTQVEDVTNGLVARWEFEGNYLDTSGYGTPANGTAVGDVTLVTDPQRGGVLSIRPNATSTTEPIGYLDCGNGSKFNFTTAMSLTFWLKEPVFDASLDNSWRRLVTKGEDSWRTGTAAYSASENKMQICLKHNTGSFSGWTSNIWSDESWVFLTWTWQQGAIRIYADGQEVLSDAVSGTTLNINSASVAIGEIWEAFPGPTSPSYGRPFRGLFDDVRLYNRALSPLEVQAIMDSTTPTKTCDNVIRDGYRNDADLAGPTGDPDCSVNVYDLAGMSDRWLQCNDPEDPTCVLARNNFDFIFENNFEDDHLGRYELADYIEDWNPSHTILDENEIVDILLDNDSHYNKVMRGYYPEGTWGPDQHGFLWSTTGTGELTEMYFSYDTKFKPGFEWVLGGKMPGMQGGPSGLGHLPTPEDGFSARTMWKEEGALVFYIYHQDRTIIYGSTWYWPGVYLASGQWYNITIRVVLNTITDGVGANDGILEGWVDGHLLFQKIDVKYLSSESIKIDRLAIDSFFGGSTYDWAATRDEHIDFDHFVSWTYSDQAPDVPHGSVPSQASKILLHPYYSFSP